jgi:anti-sigma factor RsiW
MTCRELNDFISDYLSDDLAPGERSEFDKHLVKCQSCGRYLETYRLTIRAAKAAFTNPNEPVPYEAPAELVAAILAARRRTRQNLE